MGVLVNSVITPNMNLIEPTVGQEAGPQYALDINASLTLIDQHDHSAGKGVLITPAGININTALAFNNNPATGLSYESFIAGASATTALQAVSVATASNINELWYTDSNGTSTQITKNGEVNVVASSIPGESYDAGTFIWTQTQSSLPTTPANFDIGSITIRPNAAGTTNGVILGPPSGISSQYNIQLPAIPSSQSFLTIDTSGNIAPYASINQGISRSNLVVVGQQISASCGIFNTANTSPTNVTNLSVTITTTGRPVMVMLIPDGSGNESGMGTAVTVGGSGISQSAALFQIIRDAGIFFPTTVALSGYAGTSGQVLSSTMPIGGLMTLDVVGAGTHTYIVQAQVIDGTHATMLWAKLCAYEL